MFKEPTLWKNQKEVIALSKRHPNLAILHDMGTGKTCSTIQIVRHKCAERGRLLKILVLAPPVTLKNWKREFAMFSKIPDRDVVVLSGSSKDRMKNFIKAVEQTEGDLCKPKVIITNYEAMQMQGLHALLKAWQPDILICDEAHRVKNKDSVRARKVCEIADGAQHKYLLTGTPILRNGMDIFFPYRILDKGETFGVNFYAFRAKYFSDANARRAGTQGYFPNFVANANTYEELNKKIYAKAHRAVKSECMDLPPFVRITEPVELSPEQRKAYKQMRDEYVTFLDHETKSGKPVAVVAQLAITKALRLLQIASGFAKAEDGNEYEFKKTPRLERLQELLEELTPDNKVIVWASFKNNYIQIAKVCDELGIQYASLHGETKDKDAEMDLFRNNPACRVIIANQQAGGIGVNLIEASYAIYYSRNFSLEADLQSEARNYRGGTAALHSKVTRIDMYAPETIDELVTEALANKLNIAEKILRWNPKEI